MAWRLALAQSPRHDPTDQPLPAWAAHWHAAHAAHADITTYATVGL